MSRVSNGNWTSKQTNSKRFASLDRLACSLIAKHAAFDIHDVGVSSGITSLEFHDELRALRVPVRLTISDKYSVYYATGSLPICIWDAEGEAIEYYFCGVLAKNKVSRSFPLSKLLYRFLSSRVRRAGEERRFALLHAEVLKRINCGAIRFIDYDIMTPLSEEFSFIRCMNLLNVSYFSEAEIRKALKNLISGLRTDGILLLGSTLSAGENAAGFYLKTNRGLRLLESCGGGSAINDLVLSI